MKKTQSGLKVSAVILLCFAMLMALAACSSSAPAGTATATKTPEPTATPAERKPVKLVLYHNFQAYDLETMDKAIKKYQEENKNVTVELKFARDATAYNAVLAAGDQTDILMTAALGEAATKEWIIPIDDLIKKEKIDMSKYFKGMPERVTYKNKMYALPFYHHQFLIWYNKDLFDKNSIAYPKNDWTYDEMATDALKIMNPKENVAGLQNLTTLYQTVAGAFNGATKNTEGTQLVVDQPDALKGIEFLTNLAKQGADGIHEGAKALGFPGKDLSFDVNKNVGMIVTFTNKFTSMNKAGVKYGLAPLPKGPKKQQGLGLLFGLGVTKSSKNPDEAFKLIKYLSYEKEANILFSQALMGLPVIDDKEVNDAWVKSLPSQDMADVILYQAKNSNSDGEGYLTNIPGSQIADTWAGYLNNKSTGVYAGKVDLYSQFPAIVKKINADWLEAQKAAESNKK